MQTSKKLFDGDGKCMIHEHLRIPWASTVHVWLFPTNEFYDDLCQITKPIGTNIKASWQEWI